MALIIKVSIRCDKCGALFDLTTTQTTGMQLRKIATKYGWVYHGKDFCNNCRPKNKEGNNFKHSKNRLIRNRQQ